jgi:hypothetical protein
MNWKKAVVLAIICYATGCTPMSPYEEVVTRCHAEQIANLEFEFEASCEAAQKNVDLAQQLMIDRGLVKNGAEFKAYFWTLPIRVHALERLHTEQPGDPDYIEGRDRYVSAWFSYSPFGSSVELNRSGKGLLHELLHAYQATQGGAAEMLKPHDENHAHWQEWGWFDDTAAFEQQSLYFAT